MSAAKAKRSGAGSGTRMEAMPTDDDASGPGCINGDGRKLHPACVFQVKPPIDSREPWDCCKLIATKPQTTRGRRLPADMDSS